MAYFSIFSSTPVFFSFPHSYICEKRLIVNVFFWFVFILCYLGTGRDHAEREKLARHTHRTFGHRSRVGPDRFFYRATVTAIPGS